MTFSILVQSNNLSNSILRLCEILLKNHHIINCLFFYDEGVKNLIDKNIHAWETLGIDLYACSVSSENYGLQETDRIKIAGLTTFFAYSIEADRVLKF